MLYDGSLLLLHLKIKNEFILVGGMSATKLVLSNKSIESSNLVSGAWRELADGGGLKHVDITIVGSFSNSAAEKEMRELAFSGKLAEYELSFANGDSLFGKFQITYYERMGEAGEEERYVMSLSSSGEYSWYF
jgi:predicted secreted protein